MEKQVKGRKGRQRKREKTKKKKKKKSQWCYNKTLKITVIKKARENSQRNIGKEDYLFRIHFSAHVARPNMRASTFAIVPLDN
jgi:hypothetical protein